MTVQVHIIIVTYNSQKVLPICIDHLEDQSQEIANCVIVDSGSDDKKYLREALASFPVTVIESKNLGFAKANNKGFKSLELKDEDIVVFMNPDAFLTKDCLQKAVEVLLGDDNRGVVGAKLLGYDLDKNEPTGRIDSTGIFRKWYGRWYDRGKGGFDQDQYNVKRKVPAICGAFMCCRASALQTLEKEVFDEDFFLYKEDIELSLRLRKSGWILYYHPSVVAYHCRGWSTRRRKVDVQLRLMSAANEVLLYKKHPSPYILWAVAKYILVRVCKV